MTLPTFLWCLTVVLTGIYSDKHSSSDLAIMVLDNSTGFSLNQYEISETGVIVGKLDEDSDWKPRCRPWYIDAVRYTCDGSLEQIFGDMDTFIEFYEYISSGGATDECQSAKTDYDDIFYITYDNITGEYYSQNVTKSADIIWTRYVFSTREVGITAAQCVMDTPENGGVLLGIPEIDYTLQELSDFLNHTSYNDDSFSWVFESDRDDPDMVASSDGNVLTNAQDLDGLTCYSDTNSTLVAYEATDHPNDEISVLSKLIINVTTIDSLPTTIGESETIRTTIDLPYVESSRVLTGK